MKLGAGNDGGASSHVGGFRLFVRAEVSTGKFGDTFRAMVIRPYRDKDAEPTRSIYERAVHQTAAAHYEREQLDAWAPGANSDAYARWAEYRRSAQTIVAVEDEQVAGFSDLVDDTLLDMLFVDPSYGRRGIASALIAEIVALAAAKGAPHVETHSSLTARPVFEKNGFKVVAEETPVIRGVALANFRMRFDLRTTQTT